jgi:tetraprenyl-beta-curcumene synthase
MPSNGKISGSASVFIGAARRYWLSVFPAVHRELSHWLARASEIPDPVLRRLALEAQRHKRGNIEGAAAFAAFVHPASRPLVVRALVAFQTAYDYADTLSEQPSCDPSANGYRLHQALLVALDPGVPHIDYYKHNPRREDAGYFDELVDSCRFAVEALCSYAAVTEHALRAASRIVSYQRHNLSELLGGHEALARWAKAETPRGTDLRWWEIAASAGSSLAIFALIAAAAGPRVRPAEADAVGDAYFPWVGALHTLLDSLVDRREDAAAGQRSLLDYYSSPQEAAARLGLLAAESVSRIRRLPCGREHVLLLAGMTSHYLSTPEALRPDALLTARSVLGKIGGLAAPTMLVMSTRRVAGRSEHGSLARGLSRGCRTDEDRSVVGGRGSGCSRADEGSGCSQKQLKMPRHGFDPLAG